MGTSRKKTLKSILNRNRLMCLFLSLAIIASVVLYFTKLINTWYALILESYLIGMLFLLNTSVQEIKHGAPLPIINAILGLLFFATSIFLIAYGFSAEFLAMQ